MIDEIDSLIGDTLFSVLRHLPSGYDQTSRELPHSIVLCGFRDVRDYRIRSSSKNAAVAGGSAFNVTAKSLRLGDFADAEVRAAWPAQRGDRTGVHPRRAGRTVWRQTCGQPSLVNYLCEEACSRSDGRRAMTADDILDSQEVLALCSQSRCFVKSTAIASLLRRLLLPACFATECRSQ